MFESFGEITLSIFISLFATLLKRFSWSLSMAKPIISIGTKLDGSRILLFIFKLCLSHGPNCCCGDFELVTVWVSHPCFHINLKIIFFFSLLFVWTYNFTTTELASIFLLFQALIEFLSHIFALSPSFIWLTYFISVFIFFISQFFPSFIGFHLNTSATWNNFA